MGVGWHIGWGKGQGRVWGRVVGEMRGGLWWITININKVFNNSR